MQLTQPDLFSKADPLVRARQLGHRSAARAAARAGDDWQARAAAAISRYAALVDHPWLLEEARGYAEATGLPAPPDKRAWGNVTRTLQRLGLIRAVGYRAAISSHGSPKVLWRSR